MNVLLVVLHVIVCVFLIAVVLLQRGKGAEMGAVFGGGASSTVFGGRGAGNFLTKLTTGSAVIFMCTSLTLSYFATKDSSEQLFEDGVESEAAAPAENAGPFENLGEVAPEAAAIPAAGAEATGEAGAAPEADSAPEAGAAAPAPSGSGQGATP